MKIQRIASGIILIISFAVLLHPAFAAKSAKNPQQPVKKSVSAMPDAAKPFSESDPVSKPKPIEINPRDLQNKQPSFIKTKH
jgi:hypothetical protein